ncbi:hypothetical protein XENOCAPTIV_001641 [Xenoophorus captivus]|uniref:Uncharacterized protein n=1 Tax=Xenoophorus captivus TaxID=1517983 RepID=A0ABV0S442_9TELE
MAQTPYSGKVKSIPKVQRFGVKAMQEFFLFFLLNPKTFAKIANIHADKSHRKNSKTRCGDKFPSSMVDLKTHARTQCMQHSIEELCKTFRQFLFSFCKNVSNVR